MPNKPVTGRFRRNLLEAELANRGWTLDELARRSGLHVETVQRAYAGERVRAKTASLIKNALRDNPPLMAELLETG